jgi:hypothetical protein
LAEIRAVDLLESKEAIFTAAPLVAPFLLRKQLLPLTKPSVITQENISTGIINNTDFTCSIKKHIATRSTNESSMEYLHPALINMKR